MTDITSDDILGKTAVDAEGGILGVITKLHVEKSSKSITGITVDQGFMKPDLFVGIDYVKKFGIDAVFLNQLPVVSLKGIEVITCAGSLVGFVKDVDEKKNVIQSISVVGKSAYSGQKITISKKYIAEIGARIILRKNWKL